MAKLKENSKIVKDSGEELIATEPKVLSMIQDNAYVHPTSHPASMITQNSSNRFVTDAQISSWNAKWDYSESTIKAVKVNKATDADTVNGKTVGINVPANAKFTDTVYTHPSTHPASMITGLHDSATTGVAGSVAWSNVTGKPSLLALGETSSTAYRGDRGKIAYDHSQSAHAPSNANYYVHPSTHPASMITGLHASATTGVAGSVAWGNVTGKPSTFTPSSHTHSKSDVGLGSVQNYGIATQAQAQSGTANNVYMTPLRVKEAITALAPSVPLQAVTSDPSSPEVGRIWLRTDLV